MDTEGRIRTLEIWVRSLESRLRTALVGGSASAGGIAGVLPVGSGGTGSDAGPLGLLPKLANDSGGVLAEGSVVVLDSAGGREIKTTTTAGDRLVLGVVHGDGAPYAAAAETPVLVAGYHAAVVVTGAVAVGDYLRTSTTAGAAVSSGTDPRGGVFAVALSAAAGPGAGTVAAMLFDGSMTRLVETFTAVGDLLVGAAVADGDALPVSGNDGYVLTEDSTAALGMSWQATFQGLRIYVPFGSEAANGQAYSP